MMADIKDRKLVRDYTRIMEALRRVSKKHNVTFDQMILLLTKCLR